MHCSQLTKSTVAAEPKKKKKKRKTQLKKRGRRNNLNPNGHKVKLREKTIPLSGIGEIAKNFLQQVKVVREVREVRSVVK